MHNPVALFSFWSSSSVKHQCLLHPTKCKSLGDVVPVGEVSLCKCSGVLEINKNSKNMKNTAANEEIQQNRRKAFGAEVRTSYLLQIFSLI